MTHLRLHRICFNLDLPRNCDVLLKISFRLRSQTIVIKFSEFPSNPPNNSEENFQIEIPDIFYIREIKQLWYKWNHVHGFNFIQFVLNVKSSRLLFIRLNALYSLYTFLLYTSVYLFNRCDPWFNVWNLFRNFRYIYIYYLEIVQRKDITRVWMNETVDFFFESQIFRYIFFHFLFVCFPFQSMRKNGFWVEWILIYKIQ